LTDLLYKGWVGRVALVARRRPNLDAVRNTCNTSVHTTGVNVVDIFLQKNREAIIPTSDFDRTRVYIIRPYLTWP
jgi:hypothetical protein